jgi:tetratricopeptide (TPR) repeat protein
LLAGEVGERYSTGLKDRVLAGADLPAIPPAEAERASRALDHLERADQLGLARQPGLALRMSWLALVADEPARLARHAAAAAIEPGEAAPAWLLVGVRHELGGRNDLAMGSYRRAVAAAPRSIAAHLRLGLSFVRGGDLAAAVEAFDRGIQEAGAHPDLTYNRALVLGLMGDSEGAIDGFRRTLAVLPSHRPSRENLAALLSHLGRHEESAAELGKAVEQAPEDAGLRLELARELAAAGRREPAERALSEARQLDPAVAGAVELEQQLQTPKTQK